MAVQFGPWASFFLVAFVLLFAFTTVALFGVIAFALKKVQQQIDKLTVMAEPLVAKASNTLDTVQRITENVGEKADAILTKGEVITDNLTEKVDQTSSVVQKTVTTPLINFSSLIKGLGVGMTVWSRTSSENAKSAVGKSHRNGASTAPDPRETTIPSGR
jgi:predicted PurR-regulated permease PerM